MFLQPVKNIATFNSSLNSVIFAITLSTLRFMLSLSIAGFRNGKAALHILEPKAMPFAISSPFLIPPVAIIGIVKGSARHSTMLSTVEIPQFQPKRLPKCAPNSSPSAFARYISAAAKLVPPKPPTSIADTPDPCNIFAIV